MAKNLKDAKYLEKEELKVLVDYINDSLAEKANINDIPEIELPQDLVHTDDLAGYAQTSDLEGLARTSDLANFVTSNDISDVVRQDTLNNYALNSELENYALASDVSDLSDSITELEGKVTGVYHFKGSVADLTALQAVQNPEAGDVYNLEDTGMNAAWTGEMWDEFGTVVDLTGYVREEDIQAITREELDVLLYSGKAAIVNDLSGLYAMISNNKSEVSVTLNDDVVVTEPLIVPQGKKVNLNLSGNAISSSGVALQVMGGEVVVSNGSVASSSNDAIMVNNGGSLTVDGANITSTSRNAISAKNGGSITINSGNIQSQEAGLLGMKDSTITINGGTITGIDNGPVMGNGSAAGTANDGTNMNVVMNGGTLIAHIQSAGYIACGVYVPNSGSFTMNGGEIISDGCGICMRGGTVNLNGGTITANGETGVLGKVGDSRVVVGPYAVVYDANSKYPAMDTLELNIANGMVLNGTDGDIQTILADGMTANINDNRQ